ncbi:peptidylprolyl isomerase [Fusibacter ferrireducens]|uniref:Peptidyl-prolyl cis-trans isomerase n=1 Tax=Fusibacter ferrireducens TaxID=2785058 RepID=A0ABR9ZZU6_9FIRM|nr:peptidylprolyl isomerase [Fusibacter ferrireducens]MBF4695966.1 peptidylprolyl isomerase [Fusibacter ferrireducens]
MNPQVKIEVKGFGTMVAELYPEIAPTSVNNFLTLASEGYYDGLIFHRVIKGFMIQGGCPHGSGMGGPGYGIKGEFSSNGFKNDLKHTEGVLSMARSQMPNSAGSQIFIMHKNSPHLDGSYAAFGKVIEGLELVDQIANVKTGAQDRPKEDVVIEKMTVELNGYEIGEIEKF